MSAAFFIGGFGCAADQAQERQQRNLRDAVELEADRYLTATPDDLRIVSIEWLKERVGSSGIFILDSREPGEFARLHIPGSVNIPFREAGRQANLSKLPADGVIVLVCRSGHLASMLNPILTFLGYRVKTLKGGINAWLKSGGNVVGEAIHGE